MLLPLQVNGWQKWIVTKPSKEQVHAGMLYLMEVHPCSQCQTWWKHYWASTSSLALSLMTLNISGTTISTMFVESFQGYQSTPENRMVSTQRSPMYVVTTVHACILSHLPYADPVLCTCTLRHDAVFINGDNLRHHSDCYMHQIKNTPVFSQLQPVVICHCKWHSAHSQGAWKPEICYHSN